MINKVICPYCGKEAKWCENKEIYGKNYGLSYMCYFCKDCNSYVGCHNNTREPLGTMANKELRRWRMTAHAVIDPLWKKGSKKDKYIRRLVYFELKRFFGKKIHIGESDIQTCKKIINYFNNKSNDQQRKNT